jgi:hypothetical protein
MDIEFNNKLSDMFKGDYHNAAEFFGRSERTVRRWIKDKPCPTAKKLLDIAHRGYLPNDKPWNKCSINSEGNMETPWGVCRPSDLAFVHHYKNHARLQTKVIKNYRESNKESDRLVDELIQICDQLGSVKKKLGVI